MKKMSITIKPMNKTNVEGIIAIEEATYGEHHWSADSFYSELTNNLAKYSCAFSQTNELLGYAGCWLIMDEAHITNIAVAPEHRRKKIGEALLKQIIEECLKNGIKYITLEVRAGNTTAIALYEKYGFKSLGLRKKYYQNNNEDAIIMWTENIFWDKFKLNYNKNKQDLEEKIDIL